MTTTTGTLLLAACLLIAAASVSAQISVPRLSAPVLPSFGAPAAAAAAGAIPLPAGLSSALAPGLAPAPALAAFAAPMSGSTPPSGKGKTPDEAPAAVALSEFSRLVAALTGGDAAKSAAAAEALRALMEQHLNGDPDPVKTKVLDPKPMQIPAGMYEVQQKARKLRDMKDKDAEKWLKENSVPVVEDYKGRLRPVDHHHEARAAWEADQDDIYTHRYLDDALHRRIKALSKDEFYAVTRAMGLFYDRDQFGAGPHDPNHLPEDVRGLADDPFRSVAWQVRKRGGYEKTSVPFAEFRWAEFFRARLKTYPTRADFEKSVTEALAVAHDPAARGLPGYTPR
ncbi:MAG: hypothetical protein KGJ84_11790 [Elusimicrobia bacterium]|nr:hypothetical protein [Elusimicrobiota bacterium]